MHHHLVTAPPETWWLLEYASSPPTYVASTEAEGSAENLFHESTDRTTKSAILPGDNDPTSLSRKHARAAEMVYLQMIIRKWEVAPVIK